VVGVDTQFHTWDGWRQVVQYSLDTAPSPDAAVPTKQFVWGSRLDELLSYRRKNGSTWENYFVLHGGQDTAAKLVNSSGAVVEQYEYDPYGKVSVYVGSSTTAVAASSVGLPFLWKNVRLDSETGLLQMRNRYYSPALGRFLSGDVLGAWADLQNAGNELAYVGNCPGSYGDALGLQSEPNNIVGFATVRGVAHVFFSDGTSMPLPKNDPSGMPPTTYPKGSITPGNQVTQRSRYIGPVDYWLTQKVFYFATVDECWDIRIDIRGVNRGGSGYAPHAPALPLPHDSGRGDKGNPQPIDPDKWMEDSEPGTNLGDRTDATHDLDGANWRFSNSGGADVPKDNVEAEKQWQGRGPRDRSGRIFSYRDTIGVSFRVGDVAEVDLEFRMVAIHRCTGQMIVLDQKKLKRRYGRVGEDGKLVNPGAK
jgi:RHS repeat-associated protein